MKNYLWVLWILIFVTLGTGLVWCGNEAGWIPKEWLSITRPSVVKHEVFVPNNSAGLSIEAARSLYKQALQLKAEDRNEEALVEFEKLKTAYPGLGDLIHLHLADINEDMGREFSVQSNLKEAIKKYSDSPLISKIHYNLALSHYRGNEAEKAKPLFKQLIKQFPHTDYGLASHYFLANIIKNETTDKNKAKQNTLAIEHLTAYLKKCPDCIYSADSALQLDSLLSESGKPLTEEQHQYIGLGLSHSNQNSEKALAHLKKAPVSAVWKELGKTLIANHQVSEANRIFVSGLPLAKTMDDIRDTVDNIINTGIGGKSNILSSLDEKNIPLGGDYILWKLAAYNQSNSDYYYRQVLNRYPEGDYAPESSWALLWPLLKNSNFSDFNTQAETHLKKYPFARSTPKVLFWLAKIQEKGGNTTSAKTYYQQLVNNYPDDYYSFRATGRLQALEGASDTGWKTKPGRSDYPPTDGHVTTALLSSANISDAWQTERLNELFNANASEDVIQLVKELTGKTPAALESWNLHQTGNRAKALRVIRDDIYERYKPTAQNPVVSYTFPTISTEEKKLLYPPYFSDDIARFSRKNNIDPFVAQSLMREESYFNEFAVSSSDARGLMQLLPATAKEVAGWENLTGFQTIRLFQPEINIQLGTRYLSHINEFLGNNHMLMVGAYNGGPNAMKRWSTSSPYITSDPDMFVEMIPYDQTRDYIKKVFDSYWNYTRLYGTL